MHMKAAPSSALKFKELSLRTGKLDGASVAKNACHR